MRIIAVLWLIAAAAGGCFGRAADVGKPARSPVLVELFTSEGCSSCPPADEVLRKLDAAQPEPGAELIVLSEHVDYWDHDGWKDPYSFSWVTLRQDGYCHSLRVDDPYTPQMIVDGTAVLNLTDAQQMRKAFEKAAAAPKIAVLISSANVEAGTLRGHVRADAAHRKGNANVYVAVALDHAESQVLKGENKGRHLTHTAVVEYLKKLGKLESGPSFDQDFEISLNGSVDPRNLRVVAFVQEPNEGKVLGAALEKPPIAFATAK